MQVLSFLSIKSDSHENYFLLILVEIIFNSSLKEISIMSSRGSGLEFQVFMKHALTYVFSSWLSPVWFGL